MQKQILVIGMLAIAASLGFTAISNNVVFAQGVPSTANPNAAFGQGSSQFGQGGTMGQHASDPLPNIPGHEVPRSGIGNANQEILQGQPGGQPIEGISKHPADLACALDPTLSLCG